MKESDDARANFAREWAQKNNVDLQITMVPLKEFLPKILSGQMRWCQGFSEPNSGSDLASLKTSAVLDGDEWVINGQKIFTSLATDADYIWLAVRTDETARKHRGISVIIVPTATPITLATSAGSMAIHPWPRT